jgi:hypothetical protein
MADGSPSRWTVQKALTSSLHSLAGVSCWSILTFAYSALEKHATMAGSTSRPACPPVPEDRGGSSGPIADHRLGGRFLVQSIAPVQQVLTLDGKAHVAINLCQFN